MTHSRAMQEVGWRIALDIAPLRARPAGVGVYVYHLARALAQLLPGRLTLLGRRAEADLAGTPLAAVRQVPFRRRHYHAWMQLEAARAVRASRVDLIHYTNAAAPLVGGRPYVLTVHDLSVMRMPRAHPLPRLATIPLSVAAIAGARHIIVPSAATADELVRLLRVSRARVTVIEHAAPTTDRPGAERASDPLGDGLLARLGLRAGGYLVALGTIEPRKNHGRLVVAFEQLVAAGHDLRLVITGEAGWHSAALLRRLDSSPQRERIVRTGYLGPADVQRLIAASAAACYVSLYEGYGLPVVEAMAAGAAVVTSTTTSMPQAAGGAAVLVDPFDVTSIERGIADAIARREELVAAGRARTARRSWTDVANETIEVYRRAVRG